MNLLILSLMIMKYFGVVEKIEGEEYIVRFWELRIPAKRSNEMMKKGDSPQVGDDILFRWKPQGESDITAICRNLL